MKPFVTDDTINVNIFFTSHDLKSGPFGIAWMGTICDDKNFRTSIVEYNKFDITTAEV
jgi:hypothetical protein